eukprot:scaffold2686_cov167-Pinguiococcus_pyrenoidosus.AAC.2
MYFRKSRQRVYSYDPAGIKDWILKGADPNVRLTHNNETLLHLAVRSQQQHLDVVQTLLEKGADRTLTDDLGQTPLHYASKRPKPFITTLLEEHGPPANLEDFINAEDAEGNTPLSLAVKASRKVNAETLLRAGALVDTLVQGQTVLHMAIDQGNADIVELVLDHKADPNLRESTTNVHPLHMALLREKQSVVRMLLEKGADPDAISNEKTCLHVAIENEDVASTSCLLDHNADADLLSAGRSPLHIAIEAVAQHKEGFLERLAGNSKPMQIFRRLLAKASVEKRTGTEESTPLHIAARTANKTLVQELVNRGANLLAEDATGRTPLRIAAGFGTAESPRKDVLEVLKVGAEKLQAKNNDGRTALHQAVESGQKEVVEWLLQNGANPDDEDKSGKTALHYAVIDDHIWIAETLVSRGANANTEDSDGQTPLDLAMDHRRWQILLSLVARRSNLGFQEAHQCKWKPLHIAAADNRNKIVQFIVKYINEGYIKDFGVDEKDSKGRTPLHVALQNKAEAAAECLLRRGASATVADNSGRTPTHYAAENNCEEVVKWLIENSVSVNVADSQSRSPLHLAAGARLESMVDLLLDAGADSKCTDEGGRTPADFCVYVQHERAQTNEAVPEEKASEDVEKGRSASQVVARLLLAECEGTDKSGWQPLHIAAEKDNAPMITLLLEHGNSSTAKLPLSGRNPLHIAASCGSANVTRVLLGHNPTGDYANETDAKGQTALHIAAQAGFERVVEVLVHHGVDVCLLDRDDQSALHLAVIEHHEGVVQSLMEIENAEKLEKLLGLPNKDGQTALHIAALTGFLELVWILTKAPLLSLADNQGRTPADCATVGQHAEVLSYILSLQTPTLGQANGEESASADGKAPRRHGTDETEARTVNALFPDAEMQQWSPLHKAAALKRIDMAEVLLTDAQANIEDQLKRTPMHIAARVGCRPIVQLLLDKGGKVSAKDKEGRTPLHFAAATPGVSTIGATKALLDAGVFVDSSDALEQTALHLAASVGKDGIVEQLTKTYSADPEVKDTNGQTPLHLASNMNRIRTVASLLKCGAQPNAADKHSRTPLHLAASKGHATVRLALLDHGASKEAANSDGWTPLITAASNGHLEVVQCLLEHGDDVTNLPAIESALQAASDADQHDVVALLTDAKIKLAEKVKESLDLDSASLVDNQVVASLQAHYRKKLEWHEERATHLSQTSDLTTDELIQLRQLAERLEANGLADLTQEQVQILKEDSQDELESATFIRSLRSTDPSGNAYAYYSHLRAHLVSTWMAMILATTGQLADGDDGPLLSKALQIVGTVVPIPGGSFITELLASAVSIRHGRERSIQLAGVRRLFKGSSTASEAVADKVAMALASARLSQVSAVAGGEQKLKGVKPEDRYYIPEQMWQHLCSAHSYIFAGNEISNLEWLARIDVAICVEISATLSVSDFRQSQATFPRPSWQKIVSNKIHEQVLQVLPVRQAEDTHASPPVASVWKCLCWS